MSQGYGQTITAPDRRSVLKGVLAIMSGAKLAAEARAPKPADPVLDLVERARALEGQSAALRWKADEIYAALPDEVRRLPRIITWWCRPGLSVQTEEALLEILDSEGITAEERATYEAEWRRDKARLDRAEEDAGCAELYRQAEAIEAQTRSLCRRIEKTKATTLEGCIAQLEHVTDHADIVLAGLRGVAGAAV